MAELKAVMSTVVGCVLFISQKSPYPFTMTFVLWVLAPALAGVIAYLKNRPHI